MNQYTQYIAAKSVAIEPESEDYIKKLIEINRSFCSFDVSLDQYLTEEEKIFLHGRLERV